MIGVFVGFSRIFLLGILIFQGLTARRLYKSFGVKGLTFWFITVWIISELSRNFSRTTLFHAVSRLTVWGNKRPTECSNVPHTTETIIYAAYVHKRLVGRA
jgi:hypothetical protein